MILREPTTNRVTDLFGIDRYWDSEDWHPGAPYSPIHAGRDYSASPDPNVYAPCDAWVYGETVGGSIGSIMYLLPIVDGESDRGMMITLMHCEPGPSQWREVARGDVISQMAGHGIGAPHLHYEIDVTYARFEQLRVPKIPVRDTTIRGKAARCRLNVADVMREVRDQKKRWGIEALYHAAIIRSSLPAYRHSQYSDVGKGRTAVVDPGMFA